MSAPANFARSMVARTCFTHSQISPSHGLAQLCNSAEFAGECIVNSCAPNAPSENFGNTARHS